MSVDVLATAQLVNVRYRSNAVRYVSFVGGHLAATHALQDICRNTVGDPLRRLMDGVVRQLGVARWCLDISATGMFADRRQPPAEPQFSGREGMA